jgi:hypothetical protein
MPDLFQTGQQFQEVSYFSATAAMVNGATIFTAVGDVQILNLYSDIVTPNDTTASTLQYAITPTGGSQTTISGTSSSLASLAVPATVVCLGGALATAPSVNPQGVGVGMAQAGIIFPSGIMTIVIGVGSTVGTWRHFIRYRPLMVGAYIK